MLHQMSATVVNWNVEWATPRSWSRRDEILRRIELHQPDVICLTEADVMLLSDKAGHTIHSQPDGMMATGNLRKVVLWSRQPWEQVDDFGVSSMPPGKFVSGVTSTPLAMVTVIGVCIPFRGARTRWTNDGVRRRAWEDHEQYLTGLSEMLERTSPKRLIVMGDFNQQVGQPCYAPSHGDRELSDHHGIVAELTAQG
ncbi:MAG: endonuclease/exonuclease/phosphatase family protein [Desulfovibrionales bacterium]|nr:endonuclease/exonuclease/phosphatase family protein [Desulfovibrionales bacterium]